MAEQIIDWVSETQRATNLTGKDKLMFGKDATGQTLHLLLEDLYAWVGGSTAGYIPIEGNILPTPVTDNNFSLVTEGTYTNAGQPDIIVPEGNMGILAWNGTSWSLAGTAELPQAENKIPEWVPGTYTSGEQRIHNGEWWEVPPNISYTTQEPAAGGDWKPAIRSVSDSPEYTIGKNKIDLSTSERSFVLNSSGAVVPNTEVWVTSDFIDISDASSISITRGRYIAQYNASGVFIPGTFVDNTTGAPPISFTKNPSATFLKVTYQYAHSDQIQVEFGTAPTSYEPFSLNVYRRKGGSVPAKFDPIINDEVVTSITTNQKFIDDIETSVTTSQKFIDALESSSGVFKIANDSLQLFDKNNATIGVISTGGEITGALPWHTSDFISVGSSAPVFVSHSRYIAQYDADKVFIPGTRLENPVGDQENSTLFTTEPNCEFIRVTVIDTYLDSLMVAISAVPVPYKEYEVIMAVKGTKEGQELFFNPLLNDEAVTSITTNQKFVDFIETSINTNQSSSGIFKIENDSLQLFDKNNVTIGHINTEGGVSGALPWYTSDFIRVGSNTPVFISHNRRIAQYDSDKVFIPGTYMDIPIGEQENSTLLTTEPNCEFIRVTVQAQYLDSLMVAISTEPVPHEEYGAIMTVRETKEGQELFFNPLLSEDVLQRIIDKIGVIPGENTGMKDLKEIKIDDYPLHFETEDFKAYLSKQTYGIEAVYEDVAVRKLSLTSFSISTDGIDGEYGAPIDLNSTNFPNLIADSHIMKITVVGWARNSTPENPLNLNDWRCNIFTNKGQIFHNKPNRTPGTGTPDGVYQSGDELRWDESVVWDLPERRLPSKTSDAFPYMLNPALPESAYEIHPAPNSDNGYGHGGFGASESYGGKTFPRFYMHNRDNIQCNPFFWMGGYHYNNKSTIIGTYRSNTAVAARLCAFLTTDGGRSYFNKYEFENHTTRGNVLNGSLVSGSYTAASFTLRRRTLNWPSEANKEPAEKFIFGSEIVISAISKASEMVITTAAAHGLSTNNTIQIKDNPSSTDNSAGYDFLRNDLADVNSGGNGKFWRVEVLTSTTFKVYEMVHNPHTNITARHIHSINRCKDGYMIVTGERYPGGQHIYMKTPSPERFMVDYFAYMDYEFVRLTSSPNAIQRSLGTVLLDDADQTVIFASDEGIIPRDPESLPEGRTDTLVRSSTGIFRGKLADVDDLSKFECIYEANEVAYAFRTTSDGLWVFAGQQGDVAVSVDKGSTFRSFKSQNGHPQQYPKGEDSKGRLVLDRMIIYRK